MNETRVGFRKRRSFLPRWTDRERTENRLGGAIVAGFEINPNFEDEIGRQVRQLFQKVFDAVFTRHAGQPVSDIRAALESDFAREGVTITDPELTKYATAISEGTRIRVRAA